MDTVKCEALVCSVERGSFSAAAEFLGYTPSGITRMIDALEAEIGFALVARQRNGVSLTKEGKVMLPMIRAFVASGERIREQAAQINGVIEGSVVVGTYYSIAAHWLPTIIREFQEDHPAVTVTLCEGGNSDLARMMAESRIDCCFTSRRLAKGDWIRLADDALVAWVPSNWPEAQLRTLPLSSLEGKPFIMPLPGNKNDVESLLCDLGIQPQVKFAANDGYTAWCMVEQGLGISMNNLLMSAGWSGNVRVMRFNPEQRIELGIAVPSMNTASPATRAFVEYAQRIVPTLA
ncbi:MAG: LysR family transcriptional regulator [Eggerthellaceae bacterium]|nr:LysR family transcriptional regulator [Eggerthellaceae bacterium]